MAILLCIISHKLPIPLDLRPAFIILLMRENLQILGTVYTELTHSILLWLFRDQIRVMPSMQPRCIGAIRTAIRSFKLHQEVVWDALQANEKWISAEEKWHQKPAVILVTTIRGQWRHSTALLSDPVKPHLSLELLTLEERHSEGKPRLADSIFSSVLHTLQISELIRHVNRFLSSHLRVSALFFRREINMPMPAWVKTRWEVKRRKNE